MSATTVSFMRFPIYHLQPGHSPLQNLSKTVIWLKQMLFPAVTQNSLFDSPWFIASDHILLFPPTDISNNSELTDYKIHKSLWHAQVVTLPLLIKVSQNIRKFTVHWFSNPTHICTCTAITLLFHSHRHIWRIHHIVGRNFVFPADIVSARNLCPPSWYCISTYPVSSLLML
jgi:hypothetical protein